MSTLLAVPPVTTSCGIVLRGAIIAVPSMPFDLLPKVGASAIVASISVLAIVFDTLPNVPIASVIV